jgi:predicted DNA-binding protein YlxM (UPF0122 family)
MSNLKINNRDKFNKAMKEMADFYSEKFDRLLIFNLTEGYTYEKIADVIGVSKQAIHDRIKRIPEGIKNDF